MLFATLSARRLPEVQQPTMMVPLVRSLGLLTLLLSVFTTADARDAKLRMNEARGVNVGWPYGSSKIRGVNIGGVSSSSVLRSTDEKPLGHMWSF